jgi:hypothetical protein
VAVGGAAPKKPVSSVIQVSVIGALGLLLLPACAAAGQQSAPFVPSELLARAAAEGMVPVIVRFQLPPGSEEPRRERIAEARRAVLQAIANTPHQVRRVYEAVPLVALAASAETLRLLASLPDVVAVQEDTLAAPEPAPGPSPRRPMR